MREVLTTVFVRTGRSAVGGTSALRSAAGGGIKLGENKGALPLGWGCPESAEDVRAV